jgi:hypothetical protein
MDSEGADGLLVPELACVVGNWVMVMPSADMEMGCPTGGGRTAVGCVAITACGTTAADGSELLPVDRPLRS